MEQLTLEDAAIDYHNKEYGIPKDWKPIDLTERQLANNVHAAFKAGAEWQKEQNKELIKSLQDAIRFIKCSPFLSHPEKRPKGLEKWEALIELLQD